MNRILSEVIDEVVPKFNDDVVNGLAQEHMKKAPEFINEIIESAMKSTTPLFEFKGWRMATPEETVDTFLGSKNSASKVDISKSNLYLVLLFSSYNGIDLPPNKLLIPYVGDADTFYVSGNKYHIVPVLTDTVISPSSKAIFIRLLRDKLIFERGMYNIIVNGKRVASQVIYSNIYRNKRDTTNRKGITTPTSVYLLAKYGFKETFRKYSNTEVDIAYDKTLTEEEGVIVYGSTKVYRANNSSTKSYHGHDTKILVPDKEYTLAEKEFIDNVIAGMIYSFDLYPERAKEMVSIINKNDVEKEKKFWIVLLGTLIHNNSYTIDRMYGNALDHMRTIENYLYNYSRDKLASVGIYVNDFFDLIAHILVVYSKLVLESKTYSNNITNRYIDILYYVLYEIILGINTALLEITRKTDKRVLTPQEVTHTLMTKISYRKIYSITSHLSTLFVDYAGDNKYPKLTSVLEMQERGEGVRKGSSGTIPESAKTLSPYDTYMGSLLFLPKKVPSPKMRINPFVKIDVNNGRFIVDDKTHAIMKELEKTFSWSSNATDSEEYRDVEVIEDLDNEEDLISDD